MSFSKASQAFRGRRAGAKSSFASARYSEGLESLSLFSHLKEIGEGDAAWAADPDAHCLGFIPTDKQRELLELNEDWDLTEIGYGGTWAAGKTMGMIFVMFANMLKYPGWQHLWLRRYLTGMEGASTSAIRHGAEWLRDKYELQFKESRRDNTHTFTFMTGDKKERWSRVTFMGLDNPDTIQGGSYDGVMIDEGGQVEREHFDAALSRRRRSLNGQAALKDGEVWRPPCLYLTANQCLGYVDTAFAAPAKKGLLGKPPYENRAFMFGALRDNAANMTDDFAKSMLNVDGGSVERQRLLEGEWDTDRSLVYGEIGDVVFKDFEVGEVAGKPVHEIVGVGGYDWGWQAPCAIIWGFLHGGELWIWDELIRPKVPIEECVSWCKQFHVGTSWWADQSTRSMMHLRSGRPIMQEFHEGGVMMMAANLGSDKWSVNRGVGIVRHRLSGGTIHIHGGRCPRLREAVEGWRFLKDRHHRPIGDEYEKRYKDANDALRYMVLNVDADMRWGSSGAGERKEEGGDIVAAGGGHEPSWLDKLVMKNAGTVGRFRYKRRY